MPIEHMVWLKFRPHVTPQRVEEHMAALRSLKERVPGIIALKLGRNFCDRSQGYTHGLIVTFKSRAELEAYLPHPQHMAVAKPLLEDAEAMAMDIEV
jgi:hypothetical protein